MSANAELSQGDAGLKGGPKLLLAGQGKEKFEFFKQRPRPDPSQKEQVRRPKAGNHSLIELFYYDHIIRNYKDGSDIDRKYLSDDLRVGLAGTDLVAFL